MSFAVDRNLQSDVKPACVELSVSTIRTNGGTQARTQMNFLTVEDYADFLADGGMLPPVEVVFDGQEYWLWDGFHRIEAHVRAGLATIKANVRQGALRDAILLSVGANANHGLRRTTEDKRRAVATLLKDDEWSKWSDSEIAKRCGVSHPFVGKLRSITCNVTSDNNYRSYTSRFGDISSMNVEKIGNSYAPPIDMKVAPDRISITPQMEGWQADVSATRATAVLKTFFRYPGGKSKIAGALVKEITGLAVDGSEYREPFVGGGGIFLPVLSSGAFNRYWINDLDFGIYNVWLSVRHFSEELINRVRTFTPSVEAFYTFKETLNGDCTRIHPADVALMKIAIHQISYSGLGTRAGGPIGGIGQKSQYDVSCRWNGENVAEQIRNINDAMRDTEVIITNMDYRAMLTGSNAVVYLDPPYYDQGNNLYQVRFSEQDHRDLADKLSTAKYQWVLSYDKCDDVRNLYQWANVRETEEIHYSITLKSGNAGKQSRFASEYVIAGGGY